MLLSMVSLVTVALTAKRRGKPPLMLSLSRIICQVVGAWKTRLSDASLPNRRICGTSITDWPF
jgi:hypothetical protein